MAMVSKPTMLIRRVIDGIVLLNAQFEGYIMMQRITMVNG